MGETQTVSERTLTLDQVLKELWRALPALVVGTIGVHLLIWGFPSADSGEWVRGTLLLLGAYLISVPVHEALHILPMFAAGIRPSELRAGIRWREGVVFVHGDRPVTAAWYRVILAMPGVVLGALPTIAGLVLGAAFWTMFGFLMLASAIGDWAILKLIRDVPGSTLVQDHPNDVGCIILEEA